MALGNTSDNKKEKAPPATAKKAKSQSVTSQDDWEAAKRSAAGKPAGKFGGEDWERKGAAKVAPPGKS